MLRYLMMARIVPLAPLPKMYRPNALMLRCKARALSNSLTLDFARGKAMRSVKNLRMIRRFMDKGCIA